MKKVEILFPEVANLYGDLWNVKYLQKSCPEIEFVETAIGHAPRFLSEEIALVYMGSVTEEGQRLAVEALKPYMDKICEKISSGQLFLITGNALEVFGKEIIADDGRDFPGLGLVDTVARQRMMHRYNALYVGKFDETFIVGFKSQFGHSYGEKISPLFTTVRGDGVDGTGNTGEGIRIHRFLATYLIGPLLILNPPFTKYILSEMGIENPVLSFEKEAMELYSQRVSEFTNPNTGIYYH